MHFSLFEHSAESMQGKQALHAPTQQSQHFLQCPLLLHSCQQFEFTVSQHLSPGWSRLASARKWTELEVLQFPPLPH